MYLNDEVCYYVSAKTKQNQLKILTFD